MLSLILSSASFTPGMKAAIKDLPQVFRYYSGAKEAAAELDGDVMWRAIKQPKDKNVKKQGQANAFVSGIKEIIENVARSDDPVPILIVLD